jgi:predicted transcriptional regulator
MVNDAIRGRGGYNVVMPEFTGKKEIVIGTKIPETLKSRLDEIAEYEDRQISYVVRELMLRGLSLYDIDGKLRGEAPAKAMRQLAPVVARIERGEMSRQDVQRMVESTETIKVPVRKKVS